VIQLSTEVIKLRKYSVELFFMSSVWIPHLLNVGSWWFLYPSARRHVDTTLHQCFSN